MRIGSGFGLGVQSPKPLGICAHNNGVLEEQAPALVREFLITNAFCASRVGSRVLLFLYFLGSREESESGTPFFLLRAQ